MLKNGKKWERSIKKLIKTGFLGEYAHSLDEKGRVSIPSIYKKYIEELSSAPDAGNKLILVKGRDKCIEAFPAEAWSKMVGDYNQTRSLTDASDNREIREKSRNSFPAVIDKSGRIRIPGRLQELAGIKKTVIFIGVIDRFEIWDEKELQKTNK